MADLERKVIVCSGDIIVNISEGETVVDMKPIGQIKLHFGGISDANSGEMTNWKIEGVAERFQSFEALAEHVAKHIGELVKAKTA